MKRFTENSRLWSVRHCKEFKPFKKYVVNPRRIAVKIQLRKIKFLKTIYPLNVQSTVDTLNEMRRRIACGQKLFYPFKRPDTGIYPFLIGRNKPFVLVLPGGAYGEVCSLVEGFNTVIWLNERGYNAFIGQYGTKENARYPNPQNDVAEMLKFIFAHAEEMKVCADGYAVCGFSAGGHLAASWGTKNVGYANYGLPKPSFIMLAYPVVTMGEKAHAGSRENFLGDKQNDEELRRRYSVERHIDGDYPPTFVWQCKNDKAVPVENSRMLAEELKRNGCRYEYMTVDGDAHGWGLGVGTPAEGWLEKAVTLWENL